MKKVVCILTLCICLILAGCAPNVPPVDGNTPDLNKQVVCDSNLQKELDAFYSITPYDQLLPRKLLDGCVLVGYNLQNLADLSMNKRRSVDISFRNENGIQISVGIREFEEHTYPASYIADPNDPKTYDVVWFSQQSEHYPANYSFTGLFRAKDVTPELIEARMGLVVLGESRSFSVGVLCGDWRVDYRVSLPDECPQTKSISAQQMYDMITSSLYYTGEGNVNLEADTGIPLADLAITQEERNALYSITPYDQLLPRKILDGYVLVEIYLSYIDEVKSGSVILLNDEGIKIEISMFKHKQDVIADPDDPKTYDVVWFSQQSEERPENYSFNGLFRAKDVTPGIVAARMGTFVPGEKFHFRVGALCGEYMVNYHWYPSGEYPQTQPISAWQMYDMITSSQYFNE